MNDQTRGEAPGDGPGFDVPLKRDRQRLRSSEPWPPPAARPDVTPAQAPEPTPDRVEQPREPQPHTPELREHELSPAEQLFAGQWTASVPTPAMPASVIPPDPAAFSGAADVRAHYDVDLTEPGAADTPDASEMEAPTKRRLSLDFLKRPKRAIPEIPEDPVTPEIPEGEFEPSFTMAPASDPVPTADRVPSAPYVPPGGFTGAGNRPLGLLAPEPAQKHSGLAALDIAALAAAVILPPIGLITAIVALIRGRQVRGWASDLARAAVSVSLVMTLVFVAVGGFVWIQEMERTQQLAAVKAEQRAHDRVTATSAQFCETLAANPTIYSTADPDYGWPAVDVPGGYSAALTAYSAVWAQIAEVAPTGIAEESAAISERVTGIVNIANALGSQNRAGDLLGLHTETDLATVESWYVEYCDAPELPEQAETPAA